MIGSIPDSTPNPIADIIGLFLNWLSMTNKSPGNKYRSLLPLKIAKNKGKEERRKYIENFKFISK